MLPFPSLTVPLYRVAGEADEAAAPATWSVSGPVRGSVSADTGERLRAAYFRIFQGSRNTAGQGPPPD